MIHKAVPPSPSTHMYAFDSRSNKTKYQKFRTEVVSAYKNVQHFKILFRTFLKFTKNPRFLLFFFPMPELVHAEK